MKVIMVLQKDMEIETTTEQIKNFEAATGYIVSSVNITEMGEVIPRLLVTEIRKKLIAL